MKKYQYINMYKGVLAQLDIEELNEIFDIPPDIGEDSWPEPIKGRLNNLRIDFDNLCARIVVLYQSERKVFDTLNSNISKFITTLDSLENSGLFQRICKDFKIIVNERGYFEIVPVKTDKDYGKLDVRKPTNDFGKLLDEYLWLSGEYTSYMNNPKNSEEDKWRMKNVTIDIIFFEFMDMMFIESIRKVHEYIRELEVDTESNNRIKFTNATTKDLALIFYHLIQELKPYKEVDDVDIARLLGENFNSGRSDGNQTGTFIKELSLVSTKSTKITNSQYNSAMEKLDAILEKMRSIRNAGK